MNKPEDANWKEYLILFSILAAVAFIYLKYFDKEQACIPEITTSGGCVEIKVYGLVHKVCEDLEAAAALKK